jgi:hypothetical protein
MSCSAGTGRAGTGGGHRRLRGAGTRAEGRRGWAAGLLGCWETGDAGWSWLHLMGVERREPWERASGGRRRSHTRAVAVLISGLQQRRRGPFSPAVGGGGPGSASALVQLLLLLLLLPLPLPLPLLLLSSSFPLPGVSASPTVRPAPDTAPPSQASPSRSFALLTRPFRDRVPCRGPLAVPSAAAMRDEEETVAAGSAHDALQPLQPLQPLEPATPSPAPQTDPAPEPEPATAPAPPPAPPLPPPTPPNVSGTATRSPAPRGWLSSVRRPRTSPGPRASALKRTRLADGDARRDSALTGTTSDAPSSPNSLHKAPSLPAIVVQQQDAAAASHSPRLSLDSSAPRLDRAANFHGIDLIIPTGAFDDLTSSTQVSFSKRGSMFLGGKKANRRSKQLDLLAEDVSGPSTPPQQPSQQPPELTPPTTTLLSPSLRPPSRVSARRKAASYRVLSVDEMMMSRKVRSMYKHGNESAANWDTLDEEEKSTRNSVADDGSTPATESLLTVEGGREDSSSFISSTQDSRIAKEPSERAGGAEDWTDLDDAEVDRYGFIIAKRTGSRDDPNGEGMDAPEQPQLQRVSTALQLVSAEPRRRRAGRSISRAGPPARRVSQKSEKPAKSILSNRTSTTLRTHRSLRNAANRLPHNRERRLLDEASDMLKLPPGLAEVAAQKEGGRAAQVMKAKEIQRDQKWRKMAKLVQSGTDKGGGMLFEFDTKDSRLVNRTWKGIPDRWRAAAWWSFLSTSAKRAEDSPTDKELIESFYELQTESSAEDMQIDVDVPRTINSHIMFRRRYRGGSVLATVEKMTQPTNGSQATVIVSCSTRHVIVSA